MNRLILLVITLLTTTGVWADVTRDGLTYTQVGSETTVVEDNQTITTSFSTATVTKDATVEISKIYKGAKHVVIKNSMSLKAVDPDYSVVEPVMWYRENVRQSSSDDDKDREEVTFEESERYSYYAEMLKDLGANFYYLDELPGNAKYVEEDETLDASEAVGLYEEAYGSAHILVFLKKQGVTKKYYYPVFNINFGKTYDPSYSSTADEEYIPTSIEPDCNLEGVSKFVISAKMTLPTDYNLFANATNLKEIESKSNSYVVDGGMLYTKDYSTLMAATKDVTGSVSLDGRVNTIQRLALNLCSNLTLMASHAVNYTVLGGDNNSVVIPDEALVITRTADGEGYVVEGNVNQTNLESNLETFVNARYVDLTQATIVSDLTLSVGDNQLWFFPETSYNIEGNKNLVINGECANLVLTDKVAFCNPYEFYAASATYERAFSEGAVATLILPFGVSSTNNYSFFETLDPARLASYDEDVRMCHFTYNRSAINANTPYLVDVKGNASELTFNSLTVAPTTGKSLTTSVPGASFIGTYAKQVLTASNAYYFLTSGETRRVNSTTLNSFRAYLTLGNAAEVSAFNYVFDEEEDSEGWNVGETTTGVQTLQSDIPTTVYDLYGKTIAKGISQEEALRTLPQGIYVINGKKFNIK